MKRAICVLLSLVLLFCAAVSGNGAVVLRNIDAAPQGLFEVYQKNRSEGIPNYITADFLLLAYSMIRQRDVEIVETEVILPAFKELVTELHEAVNRGEDEISKANRNYLEVLSSLLGDSEKKLLVVHNGSGVVKAELELILAGQGISTSPLWGYSIDYSQFKPRGAYADNADRARYFRAMSYASAILFAVKPSQATTIDEKRADRFVEQVFQLSSLIRGSETAVKRYNEINSMLAHRFGTSDDLVLADVAEVQKKKPATPAAAREMLFELAEQHGKKPHILSGIVNRSRLEEGVSAQDVLVGWRLFPQRYSADSAAFQHLVAPEGGLFNGKGRPFGLTVAGGKKVKGFPSGYELLALLGSENAMSVLEKGEEKRFSRYGKVCDNAKRELAQASGAEASRYLVMQAVLAGEEQGDYQKLTSALAFWTWQRYINLLYTKQSVTMTAKGLSLDLNREGARIESAPNVYLSLYHAAHRMQQTLGEKHGELWREYLDVLSRCIEITGRQQLTNTLSVDDETFLNSLDKTLLKLTGRTDSPIVVDVHTEPNSKQVVEEGVGLPVLVTAGDKARGARMSHYEFKHPMDERLTNEQWHEMVFTGQIPEWR